MDEKTSAMATLSSNNTLHRPLYKGASLLIPELVAVPSHNDSCPEHLQTTVDPRAANVCPEHMERKQRAD
uniref:Uncharacterized protein n=1 Tax=Steinernema glaseri TaxID=37863 RepID=A0A1I7Z3Q2_9BILA